MAEKTAIDRLYEEIDEIVSRRDVSTIHVDYLKRDLLTAFDITGEFHPAYEEGLPPPIGRIVISPSELATDPGKAIKKMGRSIFEWRGLPGITTLWSETEEEIWEKLFNTTFVDPTGNSVVPPSLRAATLRWNEAARKKVTREAAENFVRGNPGVTVMLGKRLKKYYDDSGIAPTHQWFGSKRTPLAHIILGAEEFERENLAYLLGQADQAMLAGKRREAEGYWAEAGIEAQRGDWAKASRDFQKPLIKEFEKASYLGGLSGASQAAIDLANSPEAQYWRQWRYRNWYFRFYNFLDTWRKQGPIGVIRTYGFNALRNLIFTTKKGTLRYYLYPPNLIGAGFGWLVEKARLKKLADRLTGVRHLYARAWKKFVRDPVKKGLDFIRKQVVNKIIVKLGLSGVASAIGGAVGGPVGAAAAAAATAVLSIFADFLIEKLAKPLAFGIGLFIVGLFVGIPLILGILGFFAAGLFGSIFAPPTGGGGPPALPIIPGPAVQVEVTKESCIGSQCENPRNLSNDSGTHTVRWEITVKNISSQEAEIHISDEECGATWDFTLDGNGEAVRSCTRSYDTDDPNLHNTSVVNNVSGTATFAEADPQTIGTAGVITIGSPPDTFPDRWPTCGWISQGPNVGCSTHAGAEAVDLANVTGTSIYTTHSGEVVEAGWRNAYCGTGVRITATVDGTTFSSVYCHLSGITVSVGQRVTAGEQVGLMGSTGNSTGSHLHYELLGLSINSYLPQTVCCCSGDASLCTNAGADLDCNDWVGC